jgi:uncharacterized protein (TIGR02611 family)
MDGFWRLLKFIARSSKRVAVLVVGLAVTAGGFAMLVLPGPGLLVIVLGLAILATEFAWAEYLLDKAKEQAMKAKDKAQSRWRRRRLQAMEQEPQPESKRVEPGLKPLAAAPDPEMADVDD